MSTRSHVSQFLGFFMKKNHMLKAMRIDAEMHDALQNASEALGIGISDLARVLLNRSLKQLKEDAIKAGGYQNLDFTIRQH